MTHRHESDSLNTRNTMKIDYRKIFSLRLFQLRVSKEMSQADVARGSGISRDMISKYEAGVTNPGPVNVMKLAKFFNVPTTELMPGKEEPAADDPATPYSSGVIRLTLVDRDPIYSELMVSQVVFTTTALKILRLLEEDAIEQNNVSSENGGKASH
jgi:transcriptional regulator with XRE-family HTH domain